MHGLYAICVRYIFGATQQRKCWVTAAQFTLALTTFCFALASPVPSACVRTYAPAWRWRSCVPAAVAAFCCCRYCCFLAQPATAVGGFHGPSIKVHSSSPCIDFIKPSLFHFHHLLHRYPRQLPPPPLHYATQSSNALSRLHKKRNLKLPITPTSNRFSRLHERIR